LSLSDPYWKLTFTPVCPAGTAVTGMPIGPPSQSPAPKSACTAFAVPMLDTYAAELAWTGSPLTGACHTLLGGKMAHAPIAVAGATDAGGSTDALGLVDALGLAELDSDARAAVSGGVPAVPLHPDSVAMINATAAAEARRPNRSQCIDAFSRTGRRGASQPRRFIGARR
jgi:hypothetical protein